MSILINLTYWYSIFTVIDKSRDNYYSKDWEIYGCTLYDSDPSTSSNELVFILSKSALTNLSSQKKETKASYS